MSAAVAFAVAVATLVAAALFALPGERWVVAVAASLAGVLVGVGLARRQLAAEGAVMVVVRG